MNKKRSFLQLRFVSLNCCISELGQFWPNSIGIGTVLNQTVLWDQFVPTVSHSCSTVAQSSENSVTEQFMLQAAPTNCSILNCPIPTWFKCGINVTVLEA